MESLLLLLKFDGYFVGMKCNSNTRFSDVVEFATSKTGMINLDNMSFTYLLAGHGEGLLADDADMSVMFSLAKDLSLTTVDIRITEKLIRNSVQSSSVSASSSSLSALDVVEAQSASHGMDSNSFSLCPIPRRKPMLSDDWHTLITGVGQVFQGGAADFRLSLAKYAYAVSFDYKFTRNSADKISAVCKERDSKSCLWRIYAAFDSITKFFVVRKYYDLHTCGLKKRGTRSERMNCLLISELIVDDVRAMPTISPADVKHQIKEKYGITITYFVAWKALDAARDSIFGRQGCSFSYLNPYFDQFGRSNPGTCFDLELVEGQSNFKRCFFAFAGCLSGFEFCRPMLFLDGTFLKGKFGGILLSAIAKDGDNGLFPVAFAVVSEETNLNWFYFLNLLKETIGTRRDINFISDRNNGITAGIKQCFPDSFHSYCLVHLQRNLRERIKGNRPGFKDTVVQKFTSLLYAATRDVFEEKLKDLQEDFAGITDFLSEFPLSHWSNVYIQGCRYGEMTSNAVESFNSQIKKYRHLPITNMVDSIRILLMGQISSRYDVSMRWTTVLCPSIEKRVEETLKEGRSWIIRKASAHIFEVECSPPHFVDIEDRSCSCRMWQLNGLPCSHACIVLFNMTEDPYSYIDKGFHTSSYRQSYSFPIYPFARPEDQSVEVFVSPPIVKRRRGRPKVTRIASRGEKGKPKRKTRCGECRQFGHNKRKCPRLG